MTEYKVYWEISASGYETLEAVSAAKAEQIVGEIDVIKLIDNSDDFNFYAAVD